MKAITTTYHGPTNTRGSRITATEPDGKRISIPYPHELNQEDAHSHAAMLLCNKLGWTGKLVCGSIKNGYVHVFI
jgi:hypothetical protein